MWQRVMTIDLDEIFEQDTWSVVAFYSAVRQFSADAFRRMELYQVGDRQLPNISIAAGPAAE